MFFLSRFPKLGLKNKEFLHVCFFFIKKCKINEILEKKKTLYIYIYSCKFEKHIKTTSLEKKNLSSMFYINML